MTTIPIRFLAASLRPTPVEAPPARPADPKNELFGRQLLDKLFATAAPLAFARYLIAFFIGVVATMAWHSYASPAGSMIASAAVPDQQQLNTILLDSVRQRVDRIATHVANIEEQMARGVDQLGSGQEQFTASQEQITRDIAKLQAAFSRSLEPSRTPEPSPRLAPAAAPTPAHRSLQAPAEADARSDWRRQPCCQWPASSSRLTPVRQAPANPE